MLTWMTALVVFEIPCPFRIQACRTDQNQGHVGIRRERHTVRPNRPP